MPRAYLNSRTGEPPAIAWVCLARVADGLTMAQVGRQVHLARPTVAQYLNGARNYLGAKTLPQAVAVAIRRGLIS